MSTFPAALLGLVDDAAVFPPGSATLPEAVADHRRHRAATYAGLVGSFVVGDTRLPDLAGLVEDTLPVSVVVSGGAGALEPAVAWSHATDGIQLAGVEIALRDEDDPAGNAARVVTAVDRLRTDGRLGDDVPVFVEPPRPAGAPGAGWHAALDEVAGAELRLKLRTGGETAGSFPGAADLAAWIDASLDRETPFKCTAGLHHAMRHRDPETGFEHHGFLNVLLATRLALDGSLRADVVSQLEEQDPARLLARWDEFGADVLTRTRRWFTSFGSCSIRDPLHDLQALGLLDPEEGS